MVNTFPEIDPFIYFYVIFRAQNNTTTVSLLFENGKLVENFSIDIRPHVKPMVINICLIPTHQKILQDQFNSQKFFEIHRSLDFCVETFS